MHTMKTLIIVVGRLNWMICSLYLLTWSNYSESHKRITSKLDSAHINEKWKDVFIGSLATFPNPSISNHTLYIIRCGEIEECQKVPLKFFNIWTHHENFLSIMVETWKKDYDRSCTFNLVNKLKRLTGELQKLNKKAFWKISNHVPKVRRLFNDVQNRL